MRLMQYVKEINYRLMPPFCAMIMRHNYRKKGVFSMGNTSEDNKKKHICLGLLAHVDAGKTTLSEGMLYLSGAIRDMGRVDYGSAFLDTYELERQRGITIFSKQAVFAWKDTEITLMDTPGHVDFSAEMERTLQVLDCAVLVISAADGIQGHTETLWRLLRRYEIPTFIFVNKMDQDGADKEAVLGDLKERFGEGCIDFTGIFPAEQASSEEMENLAVCEEDMMEEYLETGRICIDTMRKAAAQRKIFPCWFGSALRARGIESLLDGISQLAPERRYPETFGAKVYKIARDSQGNRLTYLKVTGGSLRVKDVLEDTGEKINQIRVYSGDKFETPREVYAGQVCAVTGPERTRPGQGLGAEEASELPVLEPVLTYSLELPDDCDVHQMLINLRRLEEEEPELNIIWEEETGEISVCLMGEVQTGILCSIIKERYGVCVQFGEGKIVYKETIREPVEGVGHYEPLRHYAEVHLLLEPGERGSGLQFATACSEDVLDRNWQRLILTHLEEKSHRGVLTGSQITDMKITLLSGKSHQKHTEGGDFRQATYRAVRQGLMKAQSVLLEPYYSFRMEMPSECVGRAMTDVQRMCGIFEPPQTEETKTVLCGSAPVSTMGGYQTEFASYTGGRGRMFCTLKGYDICHNEEEAVAALGYDPVADVENPPDSVFCAHGAGFVVPWDQVEDYMHVENAYDQGKKVEETYQPVVQRYTGSRIELTPEELDAIYVPTPDPSRGKLNQGAVTVCSSSGKMIPKESLSDVREAEDRKFREKWTRQGKKKTDGEEYLLVDGYNIIFAWEELKELADADIAGARGRLADVLCNYQGYRKCTLILVFDAYKVEGNPGEVLKYHNIYVVYTKEAETADQYIEKTVRKMARRHEVTVATSDALEQVIILGQGANRLSAAGLKEEVELALKELRGEHLGQTSIRNYLFDYLQEKDAKELEEIRLGRKKENDRCRKKNQGNQRPG